MKNYFFMLALIPFMQAGQIHPGLRDKLGVGGRIRIILSAPEYQLCQHGQQVDTIRNDDDGLCGFEIADAAGCVLFFERPEAWPH